MRSIFSNSLPAAESENPRQEKKGKGFVLIHFEHTNIDSIREISESGIQKIMLPMVRKTTTELMIFSGVPLS